MYSITAELKRLVPPQLYPLLGPYWYKNAIGGLWEEMGKWQFDFLVAEGLKPEHYLLDVGCGSLRGGTHFIQYLEPERYFGIDIDKDLLKGGKRELEKSNLLFKKPKLFHIGNFDFQPLNQKFDYALAQSVFTHLPLNNIIRCLMNMEKTLAPEGCFYATFHENPEGKRNLEPILHYRQDGSTHLTYFDADSYHYDFGTFEWVCEGTSLKPEYIGECHHPRDQKMLLFRKA